MNAVLRCAALQAPVVSIKGDGQMKRIIMALVASTIVATPALAQWAPRHGQGWDRNSIWQGAPANPYERIQFLQDRINRGVADGSLDRRQAARAERELNGLRQWIRRMHWQGTQLRPDQRERVQARLDQISRQIRWARHND
jgi:hypothetical protein